MTGKHLGAAVAVAAGLVLAVGQNWASAQNTADERREANEQYQNQADRSQQHADQERNQQRSSDQQWNDEQQSDRQERSERQSDDRDSQRQTNRQSNRQWNDQDRGRQSDIRFDRSDRQGLTIVNIGAGTPFYRSGLRQGDVIVSLGGRQLRNEDDFHRWSRTGDRVPVVVLRDGQRETIYIQSDRERTNSRSYAETTGSYESQAQAYLGVRFEMRFRNGALISAVVQGSPAEEAGLKAGDEIVAINGRQVETPRDVTRIVESMQPGERIDIEFARREEQQTQAVLKEHPRALASAQYQQGQYQQGRQQYDRGVEQSSYDDQDSYGASDDFNWNQYDSGQRTTERRGGRILPRLRD